MNILGLLYEPSVLVKCHRSVIIFKHMKRKEIVSFLYIFDKLCTYARSAIILIHEKAADIAFVYTDKADNISVYFIYIYFVFRKCVLNVTEIPVPILGRDKIMSFDIPVVPYPHDAFYVIIIILSYHVHDLSSLRFRRSTEYICLSGK